MPTPEEVKADVEAMNDLLKSSKFTGPYTLSIHESKLADFCRAFDLPLDTFDSCRRDYGWIFIEVRP